MRRALAAAGALLLGGVVLTLGGAAALEAWLPPFVLALGLVIGALGALIAGRILGEDWFAPLHPPLMGIARLTPMVLLLAMPLIAAPALLHPWLSEQPQPGLRAMWFAPEVFVSRVLLLLGAVALAAWLVARPGASRRRSAFALLLLVPAGMLLPHDLVLSREPGWLGSLQGTALFVEHLGAALSVAVLLVVARGGGGADLRAAERALLTLALLTLWLWFVQFVVVWMADLPPEARWYLRRGGAWAWLKAALVAALALAILVAIPPGSGPKRLAAVSALYAAQHVGQVYWLLRPAAREVPPAWLDGAIALAVLALCLAWLRAAVSPPAGPSAPPDAAAKASAH
ncbi:hypothetical protein [Falsiroseomonas sp.]|uniref:hypothetical protein n=1 Tax=Falsiroseomonas sp. TaxID=2870721 RepID=UPI0035663E15